jgi:hypothetical protein
MPRFLHDIAAEVYSDIRAGNWPAKSNFAALPYLRAMRELSTITESYGSDSAKSVVLYFLSNASSWRGEVARRIKSELREIVK